MSDRITEKRLESIVKRVNQLTGSPLEPYRFVDGKGVANVGNFHLFYAYGGVCLHRMVNESGGVSSLFSCGHTTKRDLYGRINAFIYGLEIGKDELCPTK